MSAQYVIQDPSFWLGRSQVEEAEIKYHTSLTAMKFGVMTTSGQTTGSSLASEIEKARNQIKQSLSTNSQKSEVDIQKHDKPAAVDQTKMQQTSGVPADSNIVSRIVVLERENKELRQVTTDLQTAVKKLEAKLAALEVGGASKPVSAPAKPVQPPKPSNDDDDDDFDLFGSGDESEDEEEKERVTQERLKAYAEKKAKKPGPIAKSNIIIDVKPWDDETDMAELEKCVRSIVQDGLLWGASKLVPVGYGIRKLQISCVVEDDKVSTDDLEDQILAFEDFIQSMDIAAFNKV